MRITLRRTGAGLLAGLVALAMSAPAARAATPAQMAVNTATLGQLAQNQANALQASILNSSLGAAYGSANGAANPYGYTTAPYYPGYYPTPAQGLLQGTSDVINATGTYYKNIQTARIIQTQADEGRIDYRRRLIDEARYERGLIPTTEELRQLDLSRDLDWSLHQPPISDIISARSLNSILNHLRGDPALTKGPDVRIPDGVLEHINVASPSPEGRNASTGLLKDDGKLQWPQALQAKDYEAPRAEVSRRLEDVVQDLKFSNPIPPGKIADLKSDMDKLRNMVDKSEMAPDDFIVARDYLDQVDSAVRALQDPNIASIFGHKFNAKNVPELVDGMKGLDFAPAAPGDEWAYRVLQQALVAYNASVSPKEGNGAPPAPPAPPPPPPANTLKPY